MLILILLIVVLDIAVLVLLLKKPPSVSDRVLELEFLVEDLQDQIDELVLEIAKK